MKLNQVSTNHSELVVEGKAALVCFSYGRPAVIWAKGAFTINREVWKYSSATSKHVFSTFPELRSLDIDSYTDSRIRIVDDDAAMAAEFAKVLGGVK